MTTLPLSSRVALAPDVLFQPTSDEGVLLHLGSEQYFGLNSMSRTVVDHIQAGKTVREMIAAMLVEFEVSETQLTQDVLTLLTQLQEHQLVTVSE